MKRDFDLIRHILLEAENCPAGNHCTQIESPNFDKKTIIAHVELLIDAGLLKGRITKVMSGPAAFSIIGLTWQGHDFLSASKNETIWKKAKDSVLKQTTAITFDILLDWLKAQARQSLGIP